MGCEVTPPIARYSVETAGDALKTPTKIRHATPPLRQAPHINDIYETPAINIVKETLRNRPVLSQSRRRITLRNGYQGERISENQGVKEGTRPCATPVPVWQGCHSARESPHRSAPQAALTRWAGMRQRKKRAARGGWLWSEMRHALSAADAVSVMPRGRLADSARGWTRLGGGGFLCRCAAGR